MRPSVWFVGVISLSAMLMACGSKSPGGNGGEGGAGGSEGPPIGGEAGTNGWFDIDPPDAGPVVCRTVDTCEPGECGPRPDGCGEFIQCGGCEAPASCGGAGVPSFCGVPGSGGSGGGGGGGNCTPMTCEDLGVVCGQHGDGCGGVVTCNPCGNGTECVQGQCEQTAGCVLRTCADYPEEGRCGPVSDGCSGLLNCSFPACANNERCGAVEGGFCGVQTCQPFATCEEALAGKPAKYCGFVSDGCAGQMPECATTCTGGETCGYQGDAATELTCGTSGGGGGPGCIPDNQATACAGKCGYVSDGCVGGYDCGNTCTVDEICGLNQPNVCGEQECIPFTCESLDANCGSVDDGCGGSLNCGVCTGTDTCGGAGTGNQCGTPGCEPDDQITACANANASCGPQSDGCEGTVNCGGCPNGQTCGGGGEENQCGSSCTPLNCTQIGAGCGPQGDGCGGQLNCGNCGPGLVCQGTPSQCVPDVACTNFCQHQEACSPGDSTRVMGTVYAPNGTEPLYNALVYVPNIEDLGDLPAIAAGLSCERCEDEDLGEPLVATITGPNGQFTLENVPAGVSFPLVVKMGKWRRVTMIPAVAACSDNYLNADDARLPRHRNDAAAGLTQHVNIPKIAMATGQVDAIECVLRKIGVADSEFTAPSGNGRIHLYRGYNGAGTSRTNQGNVTGTSRSTLFQGATLAQNTINGYDMAIFDCEGQERDHDSRHNGLHYYANNGGRVFLSHYSYSYIEGNNTFDAVATWDGSQGGEGNTTTGILDLSHTKGQAFNSWLGLTNANSTTFGSGYISITDPRTYVQAVDADVTERFVYTSQSHVVPGFTAGGNPNGDINATNSVQQFSFNTPVGAEPENVCGRVLYSAFHVAGQTNTGAYVFPEHCNNNPLTPQEKILEFMIFDLSACVSTVVPPSCTPQTCESLGSDCGFVSDGCGGLLSCGTCTAPETCGGGGTPNQCGSSCTLTNCAAEGATCGIIGDGCGGTLNCGTCAPGAACGGGGTANVCGAPACTPRSCESIGANCGSIGDGCGGTLNCGSCTAGQVCGAGGANKCGSGTCTPTGCGSAECGTVGDGCGNALNCGTCPNGSQCGAGGPNQCGPVCEPRTCQEAGKNCGFIGDGCGGVLNCGDCSEGLICGGDGVANVCGGNCDAVTCNSEGANCGTLSDGCGGVLNCGSCPSGQVCGAQAPNQCGTGTCTPTTCGARCGIQSNGCSGTLDCGPCNGCVPFQCQPLVDCGPVADGCGDLIDCGGCANGNTCGGGGFASKCGGGIQ